MQKIFSYIKGDKVIWGIIVVLFLFSLLSVYSSTQSLAYRVKGGNTTYYLFRQFFYILLGLAIIFFVHRINYNFFRKFALIGLVITIPLLIFTTLGLGVTYNEGARWIRVPIIGLTFQTSDLAKVTLFIYLAKMLAQKQKTIQDFKTGFLPMLIPIILVIGCIVWANLSTAIVMAITSGFMLYVGGVKMSHFIGLATSLFVILFLVFFIAVKFEIGRGGTWKSRIESYMGGEAEGNGKDMQTLHSNIAIAKGGIFGKGPGNGVEKVFLPHSYSDFIFASIIEEFGFLGATVLVGLYLLFLFRCINIFRKCPYAFGAFISLAFGFAITFQALINMGVNVHLLPVTGLTLPLVSMGGSSVIFTGIALGLILSVSRYVEDLEFKKSNEAHE